MDQLGVVQGGKSHGHLLPRTRLIELLAGAGSARVILLDAPAGYAKTTTLQLWEEAERRPFVWLSCQSRYDDPAVLIQVIVDALNELESVDEEVLMALGSPAPDLNLVLGKLGNSIGRMNAFVLAIDDAHLLRSDDAWHVLYSVIFSLPPASQVAIATRGRPGLPVGRLRARRELLEIGVDQLALTRRESRKLLSELGPVTDQQSDEIHERTEGWPAALYLAGLTLNKGGRTVGESVSFDGSDRVVVEYLRDEFFKGMDEEEAHFLYRTSILEELTGPVCDALTDRNDSALLLERLSAGNALIVPLDRTGRSFRYHHLFADMLRSELARREPELEPELHRRAARWLAANGDIPGATDHAITAGDFELAGALIFIDIADITGRGRVATLDRWLDEIGDDRIVQFPSLILARAHRGLVMGRGDETFHWLSVAEREIGTDSPCYGDLLILKATIGPDGPAAMIRDSTQAAELLDPRNPFQAPARLYQGIGLFLEDDEGAGEALRVAARESAAVSSLIQCLALAHLALVEVERDRIEEARRHITRARDQVERCGLGAFGSMSLIFAVLAKVLVRSGKPEEALAALDQAQRMSEGMEDFVVWFEAELVLVNCRTLVRTGQFESASNMVGTAEDLVDRVPGAPRLVRWLEELKAALSRPSAAGLNLTKAELRTLRFLPSHHSFRAIGAQLHLSQNTVKTQANSLYRKLGVNSRAEAVMEGRRLGLIDGESG